MEKKELEEFDYSGYALVELMGRKVIAGMVDMVTMGSVRMLRVDSYFSKKSKVVTQYYMPGAIFSVVPCYIDDVNRALVKDEDKFPDFVKFMLMGIPEAPPAFSTDLGKEVPF